MAYNKASEEKKWLAWKEAEEKKMRELGVDEYLIQELHEYDWKMFKEDRNYYRYVQEIDSSIEAQIAVEDQLEVRDVDGLLNEIENPELLKALLSVDRLTLQIVLMKMEGFTTKQISASFKITEENVWQRFSRLRKKLEKLFK